MYFITTKRMLEVCFSAHPNIQYRTVLLKAVTCPMRFAHRYIIFCPVPGGKRIFEEPETLISKHYNKFGRKMKS